MESIKEVETENQKDQMVYEQTNQINQQGKLPPFRKLTVLMNKTFIGRKYDDLRNASVQKMEKFDSGLTKKKRIMYYGSFLLTCLVLFFGTAVWRFDHPKTVKTEKFPLAKSIKDTVLDTQIKEMTDSIRAHKVITTEDKNDAEIIKKLAEAASSSFKDLPDSLKNNIKN